MSYHAPILLRAAAFVIGTALFIFSMTLPRGSKAFLLGFTACLFLAYAISDHP